MKLAIYSKGIWRIPHLQVFLPEYKLLLRKKADAVAGWGNKKTTIHARKIAAKKDLSFITLEDGFLRSYDLGSKAAPLSIVLDKLGIYYDASKPSDLENIILGKIEPEYIARAKAAIAEIKKHKLSKYNNSEEKWHLPIDKYVLLVDQTFDDCSVTSGMASTQTFKEMLADARKNNPSHKIIIKTHPDVISGKKKGYLANYATKNDIVLTSNINPHVLFEQVEKVYTATSLLGFEALFYNLPVYCYGMPFYAGWGLTIDKHKIDRRNKSCTLEHVFAATYIKYARYINPYFGKRASLEDVIGILANIKSHYSRHDKNYYCIGFSRWKRHFVRPYIKSPNNEVKFFKGEVSAIKAASKDPDAAILVWAARETSDLETKVGNIPLYRMEDGFIRSRGLGSGLIAANSLILDKTGIHFNFKKPGDIEKMLREGNFNAQTLQRSSRLIELILQNSVSKYNIKTGSVIPDLPVNKKKILVIGQVETDASIKYGALDIRKNLDLIEYIRKICPGDFIIYKPHPDVVSGNRKGITKQGQADLMLVDVDIRSLIELVDEVHVITSLAGFEALIHDKKVVVHGMPFYHGWGLTAGVPGNIRNINRSIEELYAAALILYPMYFDFESNLPCTPEIVIEKLSVNQVNNANKINRSQLRRFLKWVQLQTKLV